MFEEFLDWTRNPLWQDMLRRPTYEQDKTVRVKKPIPLHRLEQLRRQRANKKLLKRKLCPYKK